MAIINTLGAHVSGTDNTERLLSQQLRTLILQHIQEAELTDVTLSSILGVAEFTVRRLMSHENWDILLSLRIADALKLNLNIKLKEPLSTIEDVIE